MDKKRAIQALVITFTLITFVGCQSGNQNQGNTEETASSSVPAGSTSRRPSLTRRSASAAPQARTETQTQPQTQAVTIPAGTPIHVRLSTELNSGTTAPGSSFDGTLAEPLVINGVTVASRGSLVGGRVASVVSSGRLKQPAEISLMLTSITPTGGQQTSITTQAWSVSGSSHKKRDITMIGGGAGLGAIVGAIAGGGKGAAIGTLAGAGAGTAGAYVTGKKEIDIPAETQVTFRLSAPATFTVQQTQ